MKKIKENICPQNATCPDVKECNISAIEQIGYGIPIPVIENGKCSYCERCKANELQACSIEGGEE
jgi:hypothetical protein